MTTGQKPYPYTSFRFRIEIAGITIAQVSEVTGLVFETETEPYEEGGVNDYVHQLPKRTKYQHITLKRGITDLEDMWKWYQDVISGKFKRKDLKSDSNTVAFETIELAHNGIKKG